MMVNVPASTIAKARVCIMPVSVEVRVRCYNTLMLIELVAFTGQYHKAALDSP